MEGPKDADEGRAEEDEDKRLQGMENRYPVIWFIFDHRVLKSV